jgi:5-methylcytosine-specific restriction protein B
LCCSLKLDIRKALMQPGFADWLKAEQYGKSTCTTQQSQVRRLEFAYGDLDAAFAADRFASIYADLTYSSKDEKAGRTNQSKVTIEGKGIRAGLLHLRGALSRYQQFLNDGSSGKEDEYAWPELKVMRGLFLERCGDFEDFQQIEGNYFVLERKYKDALIAEATDIVASAKIDEPEALGSQILKLLQSKQSNLVGWRTFSLIAACNTDEQRKINAALGTMLLSDEAIPLAVATAASHIEPLLRSVNSAAVFGHVRSLVTCALALARPIEAIDVKTRFMQRAARKLLGRGIFKSAVVDAEEYSDFLALSMRVRDAMVRWNWKPRDLWDVQGFFWVAVDETWTKEGGPTVPGKDLEAEEEPTMVPAPVKRALNTILYGPPGTGKTWATARLAVEICNGAAPSDRSALMREYRKLLDAKRIQFTTFHQSIGYEEFVEGLRPETSSDEGQPSAGFRLVAKNGIFREICALSEASRKRGGEKVYYDFTGRGFHKMSLGKAWEEGHIYEAALAGNYVVLGWGGDVDWTDARYKDWSQVRDRWHQVPGEENASGNSGNISQVWRFRTMNIGDIVIVSEGNLRFRAVGEIVGDYSYEPGTEGGNHRRAVKWLSQLDESLPTDTIYNGRFTQASCYPLNRGLVKQEALTGLFGPSLSAVGGTPENFVLILDEINRANVSKVLGELITLLEEDKRLGALNELTLTLPYSGDAFGVPNNLYVIGTMNTADRSISPLDSALRRRFSFTEMMPDYSCLLQEVDGICVGDLLRAINTRLEWLFDRNHQIGHAYFIDVTDKRSLDEAMQAKIVPLLGEYFYDDWSKIRAILNDDKDWFVVRQKLSKPEMVETEEERFRYSIRTGDIAIEGYRAAARFP